MNKETKDKVIKWLGQFNFEQKQKDTVIAICEYVFSAGKEKQLRDDHDVFKGIKKIN